MNVSTPPNQPIIFITGTDTGVGKTVLTSLLLAHLRRRGCCALALKPFCSGGRGDAKRLQALQTGDLTVDETNPFHFPEPVAPLAAARKHRQTISMASVLKHIAFVASQRLPFANRQSGKAGSGGSKAPAEQYLLIEGAGGLLVPLGEGYTTLDLINALNCEVIVVSRNRLGTINHTLLTARVFQSAAPARSRITHRASRITVALMESGRPDVSSRTNAAILTELLSPIPLVSIPWLGADCHLPVFLAASAGRLRPRLVRLVKAGQIA